MFAVSNPYGINSAIFNCHAGDPAAIQYINHLDPGFLQFTEADSEGLDGFQLAVRATVIPALLAITKGYNRNRHIVPKLFSDSDNTEIAVANARLNTEANVPWWVALGIWATLTGGYSKPTSRSSGSNSAVRVLQILWAYAAPLGKRIGIKLGPDSASEVVSTLKAVEAGFAVASKLSSPTDESCPYPLHFEVSSETGLIEPKTPKPTTPQEPKE